ncbi:MAG: hypothetical protein H0T79_22560 [Deltaproteobacteria bacterium]|nr:hypothetical protein [Deltaproteobacteria bacterium]
MARAGLVALVTLAAAAGCAPTVASSNLVAVDQDGNPITSLRVDVTPVGRTTLVPILITNVGDDTSSPLSLAMSGEAAAEFTIRPGSCVDLTLDPQVTCRTSLEFHAQVAGQRMARLTISSAEASTVLDLLTDVFDPAVR